MTIFLIIAAFIAVTLYYVLRAHGLRGVGWYQRWLAAGVQQHRAVEAEAEEAVAHFRTVRDLPEDPLFDQAMTPQRFPSMPGSATIRPRHIICQCTVCGHPVVLEVLVPRSHKAATGQLVLSVDLTPLNRHYADGHPNVMAG